MSHCHDEHDHHGHDHSEGAAHDHTDDLTPALQNHIYDQIDFGAITALNESQPRSGEKVVRKTWAERLDPSPELVSDADEQLLVHIPYTSIERAVVMDFSNKHTASRHKYDYTVSSFGHLPRKMLL